MGNCTCTNCIFIDGGRRYCYDCEQYTKMPSREELERQLEKAGERLQAAKDELVEDG